MSAQDLVTVEGILNAFDASLHQYEHSVVHENTAEELGTLRSTVTSPSSEKPEEQLQPLEYLTRPIDAFRTSVQRFQALNAGDTTAKNEALRIVDEVRSKMQSSSYTGNADTLYTELENAKNLIEARFVTAEDRGFVSVQKDTSAGITLAKEGARNFPQAHVVAFQVPADGTVTLEYMGPNSTESKTAKFSGDRAGRYDMGWQVERRNISPLKQEYVVRVLPGSILPFQLTYQGRNLLDLRSRRLQSSAFTEDMLAVGRSPSKEPALPLLSREEFSTAWEKSRVSASAPSDAVRTPGGIDDPTPVR